MAYNKKDIFKKQIPGEFLVSKTSELQPVINESGYYTQKRHIRSAIPFSDRFIFSFDSQINPTILPGNLLGLSKSQVPIEVSYMLSELNEPLMSEDNNNLIIE